MQIPKKQSCFDLTQLQNHRIFLTFLFGFFSGLPLALTGSTLQAWMSSLKMDLTIIGAFSLISLPYSFKFVWAPFLDRYMPPFFNRRVGWIAIAQLLLILELIAVSFCHPIHTPIWIVFWMVAIAFSSASQDIAIDAYRTEMLHPEEFGIGAAMSNLGYRLAMIASGSIALILSDSFSWNQVYRFMAILMSLGVLTSFFASKKDPRNAPSKHSKSAPIPQTLKAAIIDPWRDFFKKKKTFQLISFLICYKMDVIVAVSMLTPFLMHLGFTRTEIGTIYKGFGLVAMIVGSIIGGIGLNYLGVRRCLFYYGLLQGFSSLSLYALSQIGHNRTMMILAITTEHFFSGMGNTAYATFLMNLCNPQFAATQFALFTSLMALSRTLTGAPTGWLAKTLGWNYYFLFSMTLMIPGLLLLSYWKHWEQKKST